MSVLHTPQQIIFGNVMFIGNNTKNTKKILQWKLDYFMLKDSVNKIKIGISNSTTFISNDNIFIGYSFGFNEYTNRIDCIPLGKLTMHENNNTKYDISRDNFGKLIFGKLIFEMHFLPYGGIGVFIKIFTYPYYDLCEFEYIYYINNEELLLQDVCWLTVSLPMGSALKINSFLPYGPITFKNRN